MQKFKPVLSLQKGLRMLGCAATAAHDFTAGVSMKELAEAAGCSLPAAFHLAQTLVEAGFLRRQEPPLRFLPGDRFLTLAARHPNLQLDALAERLMRSLRERIPEVAVFFCRDAGEDVQVHLHLPALNAPMRYNTDYTLPPYTSVGSLMHLANWPAERSARYRKERSFEANGLVIWKDEAELQSFLDDTRKRGYLFQPVRNPLQLRLGVPVLSAQGAFAGSLTVALDLPEGAAIEAEQNALAKRTLACLRELQG